MRQWEAKGLGAAKPAPHTAQVPRNVFCNRLGTPSPHLLVLFAFAAHRYIETLVVFALSSVIGRDR